MRILLWSPDGAGLHYNGAGTSAFRMYGSRPLPGVELTLACATRRQAHEPLFTEIVRIHDTHGPRPLDQAMFLYKARRWLKANAHRFDVFHGIDIFEATVRPAVWAESLGLPAVVKPAAHGVGLTPGTSWRRVFRLPERRRALLLRVSAVVAISRAIEVELQGFGIEQVARIPNGVDTTEFRPPAPGERARIRTALGWPGDAFVVLFVGEVSPRKRPGWVIGALESLLADQGQVQLVIAGPQLGRHREALQAALSPAWDGRIRFTGHQREIADYYRGADLFVLPSSREGMPNALLEAMASGLPALVTRVSGSEDVVRDGVEGFFVDGPEAICKRVLAYLADPELVRRHGLAGRARVVDGHASEQVLDAYLDLFRSLTRDPNR